MAIFQPRGTVPTLFFDGTDYAAIVATNAITQAEIGTATDITGVEGGEVIVPDSYSGFDSSASTVPVPNMASLNDGALPGGTTLGAPSIQWYLDGETHPVLTILQGVSVGTVCGICFPINAGLTTATNEYVLFTVVQSTLNLEPVGGQFGTFTQNWTQNVSQVFGTFAA